ncbi:uncharacterized protein LOC133381760 isoform X2 [Rhineura floridana]|uniref:uncharacterized protein LOC133381760 isoform X2 n=1 Tax=Rhineura floridana TaxID=261503 RepID=UPI002AC80569|nr:uncharacterized protein LOC133381760 isoform X2 [Rhineura floridana]
MGVPFTSRERGIQDTLLLINGNPWKQPPCPASGARKQLNYMHWLEPAKQQRKLLEAVQKPAEIAVVHCKAHTKDRDPIAMGNALADWTAKRAARLPLSFPTLALITDDFQPTTLTSVPLKETRAWEALGASYRNYLWVMPDGRACLPRSMYFTAVAWHHNKGGHYGTHALVDTISRFWYAPGIQSVCTSTVKACSLCQANGPALPNRALQPLRPSNICRWTSLIYHRQWITILVAHGQVCADGSAQRAGPPLSARRLRLGEKVCPSQSTPAEIHWSSPGFINDPDCRLFRGEKILDSSRTRQACSCRLQSHGCATPRRTRTFGLRGQNCASFTFTKRSCD